MVFPDDHSVPGSVLLQADHARHSQREGLAQAAAAAAAPNTSSNVGSSTAAAAALGSDPAFASLYKDPGDLSLKEGQTIRYYSVC